MKQIQKRILFHSLAWALVIGFLTLFQLNFSRPDHASSIAIRLTTSILFLILVFYANANILIPRYFERKKYIAFFTWIIILSAIYLTIEYIKNKYFLGRLDPPDFIKHIKREGIDKNPFRRLHFFRGKTLIDLFQVFAILFASTIYRNIISSREKEKREAELEHAKLQADLQLLKAQINPHFLFNALNNIYSNILLKGSSAANSVYKLSHLLRYVIYDCKDDFVQLEKEIEYIRSYIALQQLKDDDALKVSFEVDGNPENKKIAPMILIPFIENSFKHSMIENDKEGWINVKLNLEGENLSFLCENSLPLMVPFKDDTRGIGLINVKKRLELIYKGNYNLKVNKQRTKFIAFLKIKLHENKMPNSR